MKKIIKGKLYDTNTATWIGIYDLGYGYSDFRYYSETLYLKKTGEFFSYVEGGPMSPCAKEYGDSWCYGEDIIPYTTKEAREWAEEHLEADKYIELFGEVDE